MKCDGCRKKVKKLFNPVIRSAHARLYTVDRLVRVCEECKPRVGVSGHQRVVAWVEPHEEYQVPQPTRGMVF
jgi:hypothetical protein